MLYTSKISDLVLNKAHFSKPQKDKILPGAQFDFDVKEEIIWIYNDYKSKVEKPESLENILGIYGVSLLPEYVKD